MNNLGFEKRLTKLRKTYEFAFEDLLLDKEAKIPFDRRRLLDLKKMLLGEVLMTDKLINGLETSLKKLLRCRMVRHKILVLIYVVLSFSIMTLSFSLSSSEISII